MQCVGPGRDCVADAVANETEDAVCGTIPKTGQCAHIILFQFKGHESMQLNCNKFCSFPFLLEMHHFCTKPMPSLVGRRSPLRQSADWCPGQAALQYSRLVVMWHGRFQTPWLNQAGCFLCGTVLPTRNKIQGRQHYSVAVHNADV